MLGQEELSDKLLSFDKLPNSILLLGKRGCGKHTLANLISTKYKYQYIDLTDNITLESILELYETPLSYLVVINLNEVDIKEQNMILKLVEEPPENIHMLLLSESLTNVIDTIKNRCLIFEFREYSKTILSSFITKELNEYKNYILDICDTPGQIKQLSINLDTLPKMIELCNNVIDKISVASLGNVLTISNKLNYKDEYDKIDCNIFVRALLYLLYNRYIESADSKYMNMYNIIDKYYNRMYDNRMNMQKIIESMLCELRESSL